MHVKKSGKGKKKKHLEEEKRECCVCMTEYERACCVCMGKGMVCVWKRMWCVYGKECGVCM